jgi:hypothetical protein
MQKIISKALDIANNFDVRTAPNSAVLYSISFMPHEKNKEMALNYIKENKLAQILDRTECGRALIDLGINSKVNEAPLEITNIWRIASSRFIENASGNIIAFVDGADERSTFYTTELVEVLKNPNITKINGIEKNLFAKSFHPNKY